MINQFVCRVFPGTGKNYLRFVIKLNLIKIKKKQLRPETFERKNCKFLEAPED